VRFLAWRDTGQWPARLPHDIATTMRRIVSPPRCAKDRMPDRCLLVGSDATSGGSPDVTAPTPDSRLTSGPPFRVADPVR
jgi:hypothetical protein